MFQDHGLNITQIGTLLIIWASTTIVLEVPSGILADNMSRKYLMIIGSLLKAFAFVAWLGQNYYFYAFGFVLWGISGALKSGTFKALAYDELKKINKVHLYEKISGRFKMAGNVGISLALVTGGFVSQHSYNLSLVVSSRVCLLQ